VREELEEERARNSRPDISVKILGAAFERSATLLVKERGDGTKEDVRLLLILLVVSFINIRPQPATIDRCTLSMFLGSELLWGRRKAWPSELPTGMSLVSAGNVRTLEPNALLQQGITVTRCVSFQISEGVPSDQEPPDHGVLEFFAFDSFGGEHRITKSAYLLRGGSGEILLK
jgi:hypothetical protein